ncbi:hypothetical protein BD769DRAFT_1393942 [Suillus cothurnatus]|nr:hypothetical protein BD769DRAFT_1393942 [Suillus cothurnatus]
MYYQPTVGIRCAWHQPICIRYTLGIVPPVGIRCTWHWPIWPTLSMRDCKIGEGTLHLVGETFGVDKCTLDLTHLSRETLAIDRGLGIEHQGRLFLYLPNTHYISTIHDGLQTKIDEGALRVRGEVPVDRGRRSGTGRGECRTSRGAAGVVGESKEMVGVQEGGWKASFKCSMTTDYGIWCLGEAGCKLIVSSWGFGIWERQDLPMGREMREYTECIGKTCSNVKWRTGAVQHKDTCNKTCANSL